MFIHAACKQGPLDKTQVDTGAIFLTLCKDQLFIRELSHDGLNRNPDLCGRPQAPVAIGGW